jgi:hypothetical protein
VVVDGRRHVGSIADGGAEPSVVCRAI